MASSRGVGGIALLAALMILHAASRPAHSNDRILKQTDRQGALAVSAQRMRGKTVRKRITVRRARTPRNGAYGFVEFVARKDIPLGHAYIRYGRLKRNGKAANVRHSGLYPKYGLPGKIAGGVVPISSTTGRTPEDVPSQTINSFQRNLTRAEFAKLNARVRDSQQNRGYWHAALHNCNDYVGAFARSIGMTTPPLSWMPSPMYIGAMRLMNRS